MSWSICKISKSCCICLSPPLGMIMADHDWPNDASNEFEVPGVSPFSIIGARPTKNNQTPCDFNEVYVVLRACTNAEQKANDECGKVNSHFMDACVDGVSCDRPFVYENLRLFLE
eukprot:Pgem_evm1s12428